MLEIRIGSKSIAFRVRGTFSEQDLSSLLRSCLGDDCNPSIKSFAPQADDNQNIATVSFDRTPTKLSSGQANFVDSNVIFDTQFHGLSVLFCPKASEHRFE